MAHVEFARGNFPLAVKTVLTESSSVSFVLTYLNIVFSSPFLLNADGCTSLFAVSKLFEEVLQ